MSTNNSSPGGYQTAFRILDAALGDRNDFHRPVPSGTKASEIVSLAATFAEEHSFRSCDDIQVLLKGAGGKVNRSPSVDGWGSSIVVLGPDDFVITLSAGLTPGEERLEVARQVGHYVLHSNLGAKKLLGHYDDDPKADAEADLFGYALLMPSAPFAGVWGKTQSVQELAARFRVDGYIAEQRLQQLKLKPKRRAGS